jgi:hypothetical protein
MKDYSHISDADLKAFALTVLQLVDDGNRFHGISNAMLLDGIHDAIRMTEAAKGIRERDTSAGVTPEGWQRHDRPIRGERITAETFDDLSTLHTLVGSAASLLPDVTWNACMRIMNNRLGDLLQRNFAVQLDQDEAKRMGYQLPTEDKDA